MRFQKLITPALSPNVETSDLKTCLKLFFSPFHLKQGEYIQKVESWFKYNYNTRFAITFSQAREAEYSLLAALCLGPRDEALVQAFTCVAAVHPVLWARATPVYVDISKETYSMDPADLEKKITKRSKTIILQHTFGIPGDVEKIKKIAQKHKLFLIEDCAHVINGSYSEKGQDAKKLGTFGHAAFFSFGRDKAISSVKGGILVTNSEKIAEKVKKIRDASPYPSTCDILQNLLHPLITYGVLLIFRAFPLLGKAFLILLKKAHVLSSPVFASQSVSFKTKKFPNAWAALCYSQLMRIYTFNKKRQELYSAYSETLTSKVKLPSATVVYLRIPVLVKNREKILEKAKQKNIYLGDWYSHVIDPCLDFDTIFYKKGSCKNAEVVAKLIINLPCYPTMNISDVERVSSIFHESVHC